MRGCCSTLLLDVELQDLYTDQGVLLQDGHVIAGFWGCFRVL
jgi:hypothetical protein